MMEFLAKQQMVKKKFDTDEGPLKKPDKVNKCDLEAQAEAQRGTWERRSF